MTEDIEQASEQPAVDLDDPAYLRSDGKPSTGQVYAYVLNPATAAMVSDAAKNAVHKLERDLPELRDMAQNSRLFVRRAVSMLMNRGITQILDLGSGLPTDNNTHEVAQNVEPQARVVYVDNDELTNQQSNRMLEGTRNVRFIFDDICNYNAVLNHPYTREMIDFDQPVGLMMASIMHLISEEECQAVAGMSTHELVQTYVDALPSGSYLVFETGTNEGVPPERVQALHDNVHCVTRPKDEIRAYLNGLELVPPHLADPDGPRDIVWSNQWRAPKPEQADISGKWIWAAVGRKP